MSKQKHSKFKNSGILRELLVRQITSDILSGKDESFAKGLLFKYFGEGTELGKEWKIYNFIVEGKAKGIHTAENIITESLNYREKLNTKQILSEKYNLIKELKEVYSVDDLLKTNFKNYKILASIYKLMENHISVVTSFDIDEISQSKQSIIEHLVSSNKNKNTVSEDDYSNYKSLPRDERLLVNAILIEDLNKLCGNLSDSQNSILREYITNSFFDKYFVTEFNSAKTKLSNLVKSVDNEVVKIKINETVNQLDNVAINNKNIKQEHVVLLLKTFEIIQEIETVLNTNGKR